MAPKRKQPAATKVMLWIEKEKVREILPQIIMIWFITTYKRGTLSAIVTSPLRRYFMSRIKLQALIMHEIWI
jgi:hypothetical protein